MDLAEALKTLEAAGTEKNRVIYRRHGAGDRLYGVSFADLRALAKRIGRDQDLADALWGTGNVDARLLACMVADPARMSEADLDRWLADIGYYVLVDEFSRVASQVPGVRARMERWTASQRDWTAQAGWDLLGYLAAADSELDDAFLLERMARIERDIGTAGDRTRHAMNGALIGIALRNDRLQQEAMAAARRIGPVVVDHGETGCVTPPAIPYIEKTVAYREAQAARRAARANARIRAPAAVEAQ